MMRRERVIRQTKEDQRLRRSIQFLEERLEQERTLTQAWANRAGYWRAIAGNEVALVDQIIVRHVPRTKWTKADDTKNLWRGRYEPEPGLPSDTEPTFYKPLVWGSAEVAQHHPMGVG